MPDITNAKLQGCWSRDEIIAHLGHSVIPLRLAVRDSTGSPWIMSLWFLYDEGALWCATTAGAKLVSYLQQQSQCGFEVAGDLPPYKGVRGKGSVTLVPERGGEILVRLLQRYGIGSDSTLAKSLLSKIDQEVAIRITPDRITSWDFSTRMADAQLAQ